MPLIADRIPSIPVKRLQNIKVRPQQMVQAETPPKQNIRLSGGGNVMQIDIKV